MKGIRIALLGFGTVASGVYQILNREDLSVRTGVKLTIAKILVRNIDKYDDEFKPLMTTNYDEILKDDSIDVVVELTGTKDNSYLERALSAGKALVTANKYLVARNYQKLVDLAKQNNTYFYYEASVGGGIPLLLAFNQGLVANQIDSFYGILNGTCNYILTEMSAKGLSYQEVLDKAKELGYAEADESADVLGYDTLNKLLILTRLAFGQSASVDSVYCKGINNITKDDIASAKEQNAVIKLIAVAEKKAEGLVLAVYPALIPKSELLAQVNAANNALLVKGDAVGEIMLYGQGAGSLPTASAVVSDIVAVTFHCNNYFRQESEEKLKLLPLDEAILRYKKV